LVKVLKGTSLPFTQIAGVGRVPGVACPDDLYGDLRGVIT